MRFCKYLISFLLLSSLVVQSAAETPAPQGNVRYNGFYVGAALGPTQATTKFDLRSNQPKQTETNLGYGLYAGYGHRFSNIYLAFELGLENGYPNQRYQVRTRNPSPLTTADSQREIVVQYSKGLSVINHYRAGLFITDNILCYGAAGFHSSRDTLTIGGNNKTQQHVRMSYGAGLEKFAHGYRFRLEYAFRAPSSMRVKERLVRNSIFKDYHTKNGHHTVKLGMSLPL